MVIRTVQYQDFEKLVELYKSFFKTHNKFQQSDDQITNYLKEQSKENELIVYEDDGSIKGALFLVNVGQSADGTHKLWKFRHFAFEYEDIASQLLDEAVKRVKESSQTSKIELTISESEKGIDFYKSRGYGQEGALSNHYRWNETCFILSKSFSH